MAATGDRLTLKAEDVEILEAATEGFNGVPADGSISDIKIAANAGIGQSKVANLTTDLAAKVPKSAFTQAESLLVGDGAAALREVPGVAGQIAGWDAVTGVFGPQNPAVGSQGPIGLTGPPGANGNTPRPFAYFLPGSLVDNAATVAHPVGRPQTIQWVQITAGTPPTTDATIDVLLDGVSIFTANNKPIIRAGRTQTFVMPDPASTSVEPQSTFQVKVTTAGGIGNVNTQVWCVERTVSDFLTVKQNNMDLGLANATTVTTANSVYTGFDGFDGVTIGAGASLTQDTATVAAGTGSAKFACPAGNKDCYVSWTFHDTRQVWCGGKFRFTTAFASNVGPRLFAMYSSGTTLATVAMNGTSKVLIQAVSGGTTFTTVATSTTSISLNAWYRFEFRVEFSGTTSYFSLRIFDSTDTLLETLTGTGSSGASANELRIGRSGSASSALATTFYGDSFYVSGLGWRGL